MSKYSCVLTDTDCVYYFIITQQDVIYKVKKPHEG